MNLNFFSGSDGGFYYPSSNMNIKDKIGYTDGCPFISSNSIPYQPTTTEITEKICGYTYGYMANRGEYKNPKGIESQDLLYQLNNNWVCLAVTNYQSTFYSTEIYADYLRTPTDRDIEYFVNKAKNKNVKVCLKPMVNSEDGMWRAHIGFPDLNMQDMDPYWCKWFRSYKAFIMHYAELAEELKVEMFCVGCEMLGTEHRTTDWLDLIKDVRKVYSGKLIYNTNHDHEDTSEWFNVLDYIGTSAYYPVGITGTTKEDMVKEWEKVKWRLNAIAENRNKKYIFMEIGCRSAKGCSTMPWDFSCVDLPFDEQEQADFYESCFDVFMNEDNFAGVFWWDWPTFIYNDKETAKKETGFNIHLKKAEEVVKRVYSSNKGVV